MPPVIIGIGVALLVGIGPAVSAGIITSVLLINTLIGVGLSLVLNGVTQLFHKSPSAPSVAHDLGSSQVSIRQPLAPWQVVYGRDRRGGVFTYLVTSGVSNKYINMVITLAGHEVTDIPAMYFDGVQIPVDINGLGTGKYADTDGQGPFVVWQKKFGAAGEPAFQALMNEMPTAWTANHRQDGRASCYVRLRWDATLFPNGIPTITFDIKGKKVFDPRTGLTAYSENPALCVRDYLTDPVIGLAESAASIDDALVIAAANVCDQSVALRAGGSEAQFACNGSFSLDQVPKDIMTGLLSAMAGTAVYAEGKWKIYAAAFRGTSITLTDNDLRDSMKVQTLLSRRDLCNSVKGIYRDPNNQWQPGDFPSVQNAAYIAQDNGFTPTQNKNAWVFGVGYVLGDCVFDNGSVWWCKVPHNSTFANEPSAAGGSAVWTVVPEIIWMDLALQYEISPSRAQRLAKIQLERTRRQIDIQSFPGRLNALQCEVGDVVQITRQARFGWNQKTFECYNSQFKVFQGQSGANEIGCDLGLRETDAAIYAWSPTTDETTLQFVGTLVQGDGAGGSTIKYEYDAGVSALGVQYQVSIVVKNQGTQPIFIGSGLSASSAIPAGATQNVTLNVTGDGATHLLLALLTNAAGDLLKVLATAPIIAKVSDGVNLIPVANRDLSGWTAISGEGITLSLNKPTLPNMATVVAPTNLVASNDTFTRADGIKKTRIKATWTPPADTFVTSGGWIHMEISDHADGSSPKIWKFGARVNGADAVAYYEQAIDGHTYDVRISSENTSGARSTPLEADGLVVSDVFSQITSTSFGQQGSIRPTSFPVWTVATNSNNGAGVCTNRLTAPATTLPLTDGTSISMPAVDVTWTGLAGVTTYLYAPRYKIADGTVHFAGFSGSNVNADPNTTPLTSTGTTDQKNNLAVNQNFDGYIPLSDGFITVTTPNNGGTGGGSSGGDPTCVHEDELVEAITRRGHELIKLGRIEVDDMLRGVDIATGQTRWRRVIKKSREACYDWYVVGGRTVTPCEPIFCELTMEWKTAHDLGMQKFAFFGYKVSIIVEGQTEDDHNFVLVPKEESQKEMVVHNGPLPRS